MYWIHDDLQSDFKSTEIDIPIFILLYFISVIWKLSFLEADVRVWENKNTFLIIINVLLYSSYILGKNHSTMRISQL